MKKIISLTFLFSQIIFAKDSVVPLVCNYTNGNKGGTAMCTQFDKEAHKSVKGVCLYDDAGDTSSKSWKRGNITYDKKTQKYSFKSTLSCDNGVDFKLVPDFSTSKDLMRPIDSKPPYQGKATYVPGKAPMTCYTKVSGIGLPYQPLPCSGDSADANWCRIVDWNTSNWKGKWWTHGTAKTICQGGVSFGDNPGQQQDTERDISDGSNLQNGEKANICITSDGVKHQCHQEACSSSSDGTKNCCRQKKNKKGIIQWVMNKDNKPNVMACKTLVAVEDILNTSPDNSSDFDITTESVNKTTEIFATKNDEMIFRTSNQERMKINSSGSLGIGTNPDSAYKLKVLGETKLEGKITITDNTTAKNITADDINAKNIYATSDVNLKEDIVNIDHALDKIETLNGVYYFWKADANDLKKKRQTGLIAQDVEKVMPELIKTREDGIKTVDYMHSIGLLIEGIKELKKENNELKKRIEKLESEQK